MLKYILTLSVLSLIPIILAQSQESVSESEEESVNHPSHFLFKIYPTQSLQVEFLRKYAIASGTSNGPDSTRAQIITPLRIGKTGYALVPISSRMDFIEMLRRKNIKSILVEITTINSVVVDNSFHEPKAIGRDGNGVRLVNVATSFCLDSNGAGKVVTARCNGGNYQQWYREADGRIVNVATSKCLDSNNGRELNAAGCNGGSYQKWTGNTEIKNVATLKCLDSNSKQEAYTKDCNGGNYQRWQN